MNETQIDVIRINGEDVALDIPREYRDAAEALPDLDNPDWSYTADETASNGIDSIHRWTIRGNISLFVEDLHAVPGLTVYLCEDDIETRVEELYDNNQGFYTLDKPRWMAEWGFSGVPYLEIADESWDGPCRVWVEPNYLPDHSMAPAPRFAQDEHGDTLRFDSYEEAVEYVEEYYTRPSEYEGIPMCRVLKHGQTGPDTLTIVQAEPLG